MTRSNLFGTMIFCLVSFATLIVTGQQLPQQAWIHKTIDSTLKANNIPALSIGVVHSGKLIYSEGFGKLDRESPIPVDEKTLYQIASDTKKFTAILVNDLVIKGTLKLDEPITTYLKDDLSSESQTKLSGITLEMLLTHKSGIPNREPSNKRIDGDPMTIPFTEKKLINDLNTLKLDFEPNTKFSYSNFGYAVVGYICEKASGEKYNVLLKKLITDKYGMLNTMLYPDREQTARIATPYRKDDRMIKSTPWVMGKMAAAGGIYSNIKDISRLMIAQIKVYQDAEKSGDNSDPLILTKRKDTDKGYYGYGLAKVVDEYGTHYGHGGDLDGYASGYVFMPKEDMGLILLTTNGGRWFGELEKQLRIGLVTYRLQ